MIAALRFYLMKGDVQITLETGGDEMRNENDIAVR